MTKATLIIMLLLAAPASAYDPDSPDAPKHSVGSDSDSRNNSGSDSRNNSGSDSRNNSGSDSRNNSGSDSRNNSGSDSRDDNSTRARNPFERSGKTGSISENQEKMFEQIDDPTQN